MTTWVSCRVRTRRIAATVTGSLLGFGAVYAFDLYVHRGVLVGERAEQRLWVRQYSRRRQPRGDEVTVLAGGTSVEELIEGLVIGLGYAIKPGLELTYVDLLGLTGFALLERLANAKGHEQ